MCDRMPKHLSRRIDGFNLVLENENFLGGVLAVQPSLFRKVNGYSNLLTETWDAGEIYLT
jgi:hypothetical protein